MFDCVSYSTNLKLHLFDWLCLHALCYLIHWRESLWVEWRRSWQVSATLTLILGQPQIESDLSQILTFCHIAGKSLSHWGHFTFGMAFIARDWFPPLRSNYIRNRSFHFLHDLSRTLLDLSPLRPDHAHFRWIGSTLRQQFPHTEMITPGFALCEAILPIPFFLLLPKIIIAILVVVL